jgi:HAD superfamily hydrolase (TIGR01549 family)
MIKGVLLDVDGTLVLSNDAHAHSWVDAFKQYGYDVDYDEVRKLIGMGGDKLIASVQPGLNDSEGDGKKIKEARSAIFLEKYASGLQPTPGARDMVEAAQKYGLKTIVASSSKQDELAALLKAAKLDDLLTESISSDDAENSKPDSDIVQAALDKIDLTPDEVVMIGDTPYDIESAGKAHVACVALRSGGWKDSELTGALAIYDDPADLLDHSAGYLESA